MFSMFFDTMFVVGLFVGAIFAVIIVTIILLWIWLCPIEDDSDIEKTGEAMRYHKKERRRSSQRAITNAEMMIADGSLTPPAR